MRSGPTIRLSRPPAYGVTTLGPGRRAHIVLQGCTLACPGCINRDAWARRGRGVGTGEYDVDTLIDSLLTPDVTGVTVAGGEPFQQPEALNALLHGVRASDALREEPLDVLVYSGYTLEELRAMGFQDQLALIDGLVDGRFVREQAVSDADQFLVPRGSHNQRLHTLSELGRDRLSVGDTPATGVRRLQVVGVTLTDKGWLVDVAGVVSTHEETLANAAAATALVGGIGSWESSR